MFRPVLLAISLLATIFSACGTDAVGVDVCQRIEEARCEAARRCGDISDVDACQRFAQNQCLHGVALEKSPGTVLATRCADALELAGRCASKNGKGSRAEACVDLEAKGDERVCDIVREPERAKRCAFLIEADEADSKDQSADAG